MTGPNKPWPGKIGRTYRESEPWLEPEASPPEGSPNVVVIVLDDVGFAHLGCYGSTIETPHIDALAADGRRYSNFHTTSMCSPTRASLLTGRNHHAVGMGMIADMCTGYPGYQGQVSNEAATIAEMLRPAGYSTFAAGKWHLTRAREMTAAGPFDQWPLGRGFERYYGFLYSLVDQWHPELVSDNHFIPTPSQPGYHLSEDLVDQTIGMIRDQQAGSPGKPFLAYLAFGACHSPHQAPKDFIEKYRGRFDAGWDVMREHWHARQIEMGIVPPQTQLTAMNPNVQPWDSMTDEQKRLCARHQEVFAGFLDHTDAQIGRLMAWLSAQGLSENTLVVLLSDNGASAEGGQFGDINLRRYIQVLDETLDEKLAAIDELGTDRHWNNYPAGWAHAGNTPLKWFKMQTHGGGVRCPMILRWPAGIGSEGRISSQFSHCADVVPTILEACGVPAPTMLRGVPQMPIDGTSLAYTFDEPDTVSCKRVQYFELMGNRGIWADGWKAVTRHFEGDDFEADRWELYHLDTDFSESNDLAHSHPEKLNALIGLWWEEARRNQVLPLDDRNRSRLAYTYWGRPRRRWTFAQGMNRVSGYAAPSIANRSYRITADVDVADKAEGVILSVGGQAGGYVLFMQDGRLVHEYVGPDRRWVLESSAMIPSGSHELVFEFHKTGHCAGETQLICDGQVIASESIEHMWPAGATAGGVCCGYNEASPVSSRYTRPFRFTGTLRSVAVEAGDDYILDPVLATHVALAED
jgi:arylsulfatase A-like enzyme